MRRRLPPLIAGIVLTVLGAFIVFQGVTYRSQHSVFRVGDFRASVLEQRAIPIWVGGVAIAGGLVLMAAGVPRRRGT